MAIITARKLTDTAQRGQWIAYADTLAVVTRKTRALALRDATYYIDPIKCCGRHIRSFDRLEFTATHVTARCLCCGETTQKALAALPVVAPRQRVKTKVQRCTGCALTSYDGSATCPECGQAYE